MSNNSGLLSSEQFQPIDSTNFKCQFIFLAALNEHVQLIFYEFKLKLKQQNFDQTKITTNTTIR